MKTTDKFLFATAFILLVGLLLYINAIAILKIAISLITIGIILYWKIFPYKNQLYPKYAKIMDSVSIFLTPLLQFFNKIPNVRLGDKLFVDTKYLVLCSILLLILVLL